MVEVEVEVSVPFWTQLIQAPPSHTWLPVDTHTQKHTQTVSASGGLTSKKEKDEKKKTNLNDATLSMTGSRPVSLLPCRDRQVS